MEKHKAPEKLWLISTNSPFPEENNFLAYLPKNENYAVYINRSTQQPIRIYLPNIKDWQISKQAANTRAIENARYVIEQLEQ